jgi:signal transduction histidine kinase
MPLRFTIRHKFMGALLLISLAPLAIAGALAYRGGRAAIEERIGEQLASAAAGAMDAIDQMLFFRREDIKAWSAIGIMQEVATGDPQGRVTETLKRLKRDYGIYAGLFCLDSRGVVVASSEPARIGHDASAAAWFQEALAASGVSVGGVAYDPLIGGFAVRFSIALRSAHDAAQTIGVLCAQLHWSELFEITNRIRLSEEGQSESGYAVLIGSDGSVLSGPGFLLTLEEEEEEISHRNLVAEGVRAARLALVAGRGFSIEADAAKTTWLIGYAGSLGYREFAGLGWAVLVMQQADEAFAPVFRLRRQLAALGGVVAVLVIIVAALAARRVSRPIQRLTEGASLIARGEFSQPIPASSRDEIGQLAGAFNHMMEELKRSRDELLAANRRLEGLLAVKDEFVAKVSHELRTPLTSVKEGLSLFRDNALGEMSAEQQDFLKTMYEDVDRLAELVNNMLDLSKMEAGRMRLRRRRADIRRQLESIVSGYRSILGERRLSIEAAEMPPVFVDEERMRQVFVNLLSNAIKFTAEDGAITFRVAQRGGEVAVSVADNGIGIAREDIPKLFGKFAQVGPRDPNQPRGTGLGLAVCKELVGLHGGRIEVASEVGRGATFTVSLPVYTDALALTESFQELRDFAAKEANPSVGLIAVHAASAAGSIAEAADPREPIRRLAEEIRHKVHRDDVVLDLEPPWIVILAATDAGGLHAIIRRLRGSLGMGERLRFGTAAYPADGESAAALFERAGGMVDQDAAPRPA